MTREEAKSFWLIRYENAKDFSDPNWEAQERREHREYVEALRMAVEELNTPSDIVHCKECKNSHMTYGGLCKYCDMWEEDGDALYLEGDFYCGFGERREDG
mgnify:CR=1 FL=1